MRRVRPKAGRARWRPSRAIEIAVVGPIWATSITTSASASIAARASTSTSVIVAGIALVVSAPLISQHRTPTGPSHMDVANGIRFE